MVSGVGSCSSVAPVTVATNQVAAAIQSSADAISHLIQDSLSISPEAQAASAKLDGDGS